MEKEVLDGDRTSKEMKTTMENANGVTTAAIMTTQPKPVPEPEKPNGNGDVQIGHDRRWCRDDGRAAK